MNEGRLTGTGSARGGQSAYLRGGSIGYEKPKPQKGNFLVRNLDTAGGIGGGLAGAGIGATVGSVVPVIGTGVGAVIGGLLGAFGGGASGKAASQSLQGEDFNGGDVLKAGATNAAGELLGGGLGVVGAKVLPKLATKGAALVAEALTNKASRNITKQIASNLPSNELKTSRDVGSLYEKAGLANNIGLYSSKSRDKAAKLVTGENGSVNTLKKDILSRSGHVPILDNLDSNVMRALGENGVAGSAEKKAVRDAVRAQVEKAVGTKGAIGDMAVTGDKAFQAQQALEKLAVSSRAAGKTEIAGAYRQVAKDIGGQIDTHTGANAAVSAFKLSADEAKNIRTLATKQLGRGKGGRFADYVIDQVNNAKSIPELRKIEADFIPGSKAATGETIRGIQRTGGQGADDLAGAAAGATVSPLGKLQLTRLIGDKVSDLATPAIGGAARLAGKIEPRLPEVLQRVGGQAGAAKLLGPAGSALADEQLPPTEGGFVNDLGGGSLAGGADANLSVGGDQAVAEQSPYGQENLIADIQRDPKHADTYLSLYKTFNADQASKGLNSAQANTITDAGSAVSGLKALAAALNSGQGASGPVSGRLRSLNPYDTDQQALQSQIDTTRQVVGKFLEGGVLRKEDEAKYKKILPTANDTREVAMRKIAQVMQLVQSRSDQYQRLVGSGGSGYDSNAALLEMIGAQQ